MTIPEPRPFVVASTRAVSPAVRLVTLRPEDGGAFDFTPGQWVSLSRPENEEAAAAAYSIASAPRADGALDLAMADGWPAAGGVPKAGRLTGAAGSLAGVPGAIVHLTGPFGTFVVSNPVERPLVFVATGTGVAPFRAMLQDLLKGDGAGSGPPGPGHPRAPADARVESGDLEATLVLGVRTDADILFRSEFEALAARHAGFRFIPTLSRPGDAWRGSRGRVQGVLESLLQPHRDADVYVCGRPDMVDDVRESLAAWGYATERIHLEGSD